jgi:hypothetical protein
MAETETKFVRIPLTAYERLIQFQQRVGVQYVQQSLIGAAVNYALNNEAAFIASMGPRSPESNEGTG